MLTDSADDLFLSNCLREESLASDLGGIESSRKGELGINAFNAVSRVDVLDQRDLVTGGASLTGGDSGIGKEEFPYLESIS